MLSEKLTSLLRTLTKYELNRFRKFLLSPYLNDQEDLTRLFEIVNEALRKDEQALPGLDKQTVWKALYPKKKFDDTHLRRLASDLTQAALRFMVEEARRQDPLGEALELQKILEKPELQKHLTGVERQIKRLLNEERGQSSEQYFAQFKMHDAIFSRASKIVATSGYAEKLLPADFYLECFYLTQKLKFYVAWLLYRDFRITEHAIPLIPGFWEYIEAARFKGIPLLAVYSKVIKCLIDQDDENHFHDLMADLEKYDEYLTKDDLRECYHIAQNYCALKISQGKIEYYREVFKIFRRGIDQKILLENGQLPEGVFKNIITASLGVGEYDWAERFIQDNVEYLPSNIRENARTFNLSYLYFHQKKYQKVIELLSNVEYSDVVYALGAKQILLRTYYESGEFLAMDSLIESFRIFLRRNKLISKNLKREYINFLNFLKKLSSLNVAGQLVIKLFQKRVSETKYVNSKKWLLEKIAELENNTKR